MKYSFRSTFLIIACLTLTSCGGGGGGGSSGGGNGVAQFFLTIASFSFSVDEDSSYSGTLSHSTNRTGTVSFQVDSNPINGSLVLQSSGNFTYTPNENYNGSDSFTFKASHVQQNYTTAPATANITVSDVSDPPVIVFNEPPDSNDLLFADNNMITLSGSVSDEDSTLEELTYTAIIGDISIPVTITSNTDDSTLVTFNLDVSPIIDAGFYLASIRACDSTNTCSDAGFLSHFTTGLKTEGQYKVYNLMGSYGTYSDSRRNTDMLILSDSPADTGGITQFRNKMLKSINLLIQSTANDYFDGFFNVMIVEPVTPDGSSFIDMTNDGNCTDWDDNTFCYDGSKLTDLESTLFPDIYPDVTAVITALSGRGITTYGGSRPATMVQGISERVHRTFAHELGHAHAYLGDEYSSDGEREYTDEEIEDNSWWDVNIAVESQPAQVKWKHFIGNLLVVPGVTPGAGNVGTGLFEGSYYSETGSYRPQQYSIMGCNRCEDVTPGCWTTTFAEENCTDFINVQAEGFAIASIENLFRDAFGDSTTFVGEDNTTGITVGVGIVTGGKLDNSKYDVNWYENGIQDPTNTNSTEVTFQRPTTGGWATYTWKIADKTSVVLVPDDIDNPNDCYLGLFDRYRGSFRTLNDEWEYKSPPFALQTDTYTNYKYGYTDGCTSGTLMINWDQN